MYIADLGSKNGTAVNGTPMRIREGDVVSFGNRLAYRVQMAPRRRRLEAPKPLALTLVPQRNDLGLQVLDIAQFPFLISKADELFSRYREQYPHQVNYVSRRPAHIFLKGGTPFVEDLGSTNGTFVNGERIGESAVELANGDSIAFGGTYFVYTVGLKDESESTLTEMAVATRTTLADEFDSDKTTFVGSANSFLDIFCVDQSAAHEDEINDDAQPAPVEKQDREMRRAKHGKLALFVSELHAAFGGSERQSTQRSRLVLAGEIVVLVGAGSALFYGGSSERDAKSLMASSSYQKAAAVTNDFLGLHPQDVRFAAMNTEAVLKSNVPPWLAALQKGSYADAEAIITQMKRLSANNPNVRSMIDELDWIGRLESFVMSRGGLDAPIRIYQDEARIGAILKH